MQMVAASKMRRAQQAAIDSAPFARRLYRMQRAATARIKNFRHPLLAVRPVHKRAVILIAGDKGLCGALNTNVFRLASQFDTATTVFITAGKKAAQFVARSGRTLAAEFEYHDTPTFPEARAIAARRARAHGNRAGRRSAGGDDALRQHAHAGAGVGRVPAGGRDPQPESAGHRIRRGADRPTMPKSPSSRAPKPCSPISSATTSTSSSTSCC